MANAKKTTITMDDLLAESQDVKPLAEGDLADGEVLSIKKHEILIDLGAAGVGVVSKWEVEFVDKLKVGDKVTASVVDTEMEDGRVLLSLRKAVKDHGWDEALKVMEDEEVIEVTPYDANRGGLLIEYEGVRGFMPVSQLSAEHYPRVSSNDKDEILQRLNTLIDKPMKVRVIDADRKNNKLIFSEKVAIKDGLAEVFESMKIGDEIEGVVTGIVDFGVFINVSGIEGLVHISEISWERVVNPKDYVKVGDRVKAKIIDIDKDRLSLSMKQLTEDPWLSEVEKIKKGDTIEGTVTRITPFGAFVQISSAVEALVHVSELGGSRSNNVNPENVFTLNEQKDFRVLEIDKANRKISLCLANK